jgi:hypothetical protein
MIAEGIFYILQPYLLAYYNTNIYKYGVSKNINDPTCRISDYPKGSEIIVYFKVKNPFLYENRVGRLLNNYRNEHTLNIGYEYLDCELNILIKEIYNIIKDGIIELYNIHNDLLNKRLNKINIYFSEKINSRYYDYIINLKENKNKIIVNNYDFRNKYIKLIKSKILSCYYEDNNKIFNIENIINL